MKAASIFDGGAVLDAHGATFSLWSRHASHVDLCLFDEKGEKELARLQMQRGSDDWHRLHVEGVKAGARYGFRAHGVHSPDHGLWYDPTKLLVDPYALEIDRPYRQVPELTVYGTDTAAFVPKAIVTEPKPVAHAALPLNPSGLIYEVNVKALTALHPDIPVAQRGTLAALAHPAMIDHFKRLHVSAVELMPIVAWIDERHLPPLGLTNAWGYNPVTPMALDPRLVPGGLAELRETVASLHRHGIAVILDLVFNHSGESDRFGPTLSMRGIDNLTYYRHVASEPGLLINDAGTGNTLSCDHPVVRNLILDSLRHFVLHAGIDGFRFDLATILLRSPRGFEPDGNMARALMSDPILKGRILIAEPWDIGPGGYQLGHFPPAFLEWNDRARDDLRRIWRGDMYMTGRLATILAGSSDIYQRPGQTTTRSVNFLAAHDGFRLADLVAYERRHNEANGEHNRDGHSENFSWNNGAEGETADPEILADRRQDLKALLSTLFVCRGPILLTAGDDFGHSQQGNNNAYAQDNATTWLDWSKSDEDILAHTAFLAGLRKRFAVFADMGFFRGEDDVRWLNQHGQPMAVSEWEARIGIPLQMVLSTQDHRRKARTHLVVAINPGRTDENLTLPDYGHDWAEITIKGERKLSKPPLLKARGLQFFVERL